MRFIKGFIMVVGIIGIAAAIVLCLCYFMYSLTPRIQANMAPVTVTADAAQSFDDKIAALKKETKEASAANEVKEVQLMLTEGEINSKLTELLAEGALPENINKVSINLRDKQFLVYTVIDVPGLAAKVGAIGNIKIVDDSPKVTLQDLDVGKLPITSSNIKRAEDFLDFAIKGQLPNLPMKVTSVDIGKRQVTITGTTKAAN